MTRNIKGATGVPCPLCGGASAVLESRRRVIMDDGTLRPWTYRLRRCKECRNKFPTSESVIIAESSRVPE